MKWKDTFCTEKRCDRVSSEVEPSFKRPSAHPIFSSPCAHPTPAALRRPGLPVPTVSRAGAHNGRQRGIRMRTRRGGVLLHPHASRAAALPSAGAAPFPAPVRTQSGRRRSSEGLRLGSAARRPARARLAASICAPPRASHAPPSHTTAPLQVASYPLTGAPPRRRRG